MFEIVDFQSVSDNKKNHASQFNNTRPFRWLKIDGFINASMSKILRDGFRETLKAKNPLAAKKHKNVKRKIGTGNYKLMTPALEKFFKEINSPEFVALLEEITGIKPLYADEDLQGGGLHEIHNGGYLNVHTDFNFHPKTFKRRALNLICYLNEHWQPEYEGNLELWSEDVSERIASIEPIAGRLALFETNEISFHGHPAPLNLPEGVRRQSLAVYYYTDWPTGLARREKTHYVLTPQQKAELDAKLIELIGEGVAEAAEIVAKMQGFEPRDVKHRLKELVKAHKLDKTKIPFNAKYRVTS